MLPSWGVLIRVTTEFAMGCVAYSFYAKPIEPRRAELLSNFGVIAIIVMSLLSLSGTFDVLIIGVFVLLVVSLSHARGPMSGLLQSRAFVHLGRISYSAYIVHALVLVLYGRILREIPSHSNLLIELLIVLVFVALVLISAQLLYSFVEEPTRRRLRGAWAHRSSASATPIAV